MKVTAVGETTSLADRKHRAGQRMLLGIQGVAITEDTRRLISAIMPGGFVLGPDNAVDVQQLSELLRELTSLVRADAPPLLATSVQGGESRGLVDGMTVWPAAQRVARVRDGLPTLAQGIADELRALGFNLNFAPWTGLGPDAPALGEVATDVIRRAVTFIEAHKGVATVIGPFPTPSIDSEALFGAALAAGSRVVSVGDDGLGEDQPIIPRILRSTLAFDGLTISEDLIGKPETVHSLPETLAHATRASLDLMVVATQAHHQWEVFEALVRLQEQDVGYDRASQHTRRRLQRHREHFFLEQPPPPPMSCVGGPEHRALVRSWMER